MGLQLTRGGEYALRAMTYLASLPEGDVASLRDICAAQEIPESFLAKIMQATGRDGLTASRRGARGGFALARPPEEITMREIVEAVDGPIALNACANTDIDCRRSAVCPLHPVWLEAQTKLMGVLDGVTLRAFVAPPNDAG